MTAKDLRQLVDDYLRQFSAEGAKLALLLEQLDAGETMNDRYNFRGHITASGLVLSPNRTKVLLIHHIGSGRWQQPGGHWESDEEADPLQAARREVIEETAVQLAEYAPLLPDQPLIPLDIDTHWIATPRHAGEQPHNHHDFLYVFTAKDEALQHQAEEVHGADWFPFDAPECQTDKLQRVFAKLNSAAIQ